MKLLTIKPEPISRTKHSATSATTTALRNVARPPRSPAARPVPCNAVVKSSLKAPHSGTIPNTMALASAIAPENASD